MICVSLCCKLLRRWKVTITTLALHVKTSRQYTNILNVKYDTINKSRIGRKPK